jgi:dTMP kinase
MAGKFIVIEGGEGSGKDTHVTRLKGHFGEEEFVFTREPGGTPMGEHIRNVVLSAESPAVDKRAELLLFLAARAELVGKVIAPALAAGKHVVSNRFALSTLAYQIHGRERHDLLPFVQQMHNFLVGEHNPDAYILLDVPPEVGVARARNRPEKVTRFDAEELAFHHRVRQGYHTHVKEHPHHIIDTTRPIEDVWTDVLRAVQSHL